MTEISYITQNGQQINLKDAAGREMLATKQNKLKAGNGISISADGVISAVGGGSDATFKKKTLVVKDAVFSNYSSVNYTFDLTFEYAGNPSLMNKLAAEDSDFHYKQQNEEVEFETLDPNYNYPIEAISSIDPFGTGFISATMEAFDELEDNGLPFLIIWPCVKAVITDRVLPNTEEEWIINNAYEIGREFQARNTNSIVLFTKASVEGNPTELDEDKVVYYYTYNLNETNGWPSAGMAYVPVKIFDSLCQD